MESQPSPPSSVHPSITWESASFSPKEWSPKLNSKSSTLGTTFKPPKPPLELTENIDNNSLAHDSPSPSTPPFVNMSLTKQVPNKPSSRSKVQPKLELGESAGSVSPIARRESLSPSPHSPSPKVVNMRLGMEVSNFTRSKVGGRAKPSLGVVAERGGLNKYQTAAGHGHNRSASMQPPAASTHKRSDTMQNRLFDFYQAHSPNALKPGFLTKLCQAYEGQEEELWANLGNVYGKEKVLRYERAAAQANLPKSVPISIARIPTITLNAVNKAPRPNHLKSRLFGFYQAICPEALKPGFLSTVVDAYEGREEKLWQHLAVVHGAEQVENYLNSPRDQSEDYAWNYMDHDKLTGSGQVVEGFVFPPAKVEKRTEEEKAKTKSLMKSQLFNFYRIHCPTALKPGHLSEVVDSYDGEEEKMWKGMALVHGEDRVKAYLDSLKASKKPADVTSSNGLDANDTSPGQTVNSHKLDQSMDKADIEAAPLSPATTAQEKKKHNKLAENKLAETLKLRAAIAEVKEGAVDEGLSTSHLEKRYERLSAMLGKPMESQVDDEDDDDEDDNQVEGEEKEQEDSVSAGRDDSKVGALGVEELKATENGAAGKTAGGGEGSQNALALDPVAELERRYRSLSAMLDKEVDDDEDDEDEDGGDGDEKEKEKAKVADDDPLENQYKRLSAMLDKEVDDDEDDEDEDGGDGDEKEKEKAKVAEDDPLENQYKRLSKMLDQNPSDHVDDEDDEDEDDDAGQSEEQQKKAQAAGKGKAKEKMANPTEASKSTLRVEMDLEKQSKRLSAILGKSSEDIVDDEDDDDEEEGDVEQKSDTLSLQHLETSSLEQRYKRLSAMLGQAIEDHVDDEDDEDENGELGDSANGAVSNKLEVGTIDLEVQYKRLKAMLGQDISFPPVDDEDDEDEDGDEETAKKLGEVAKLDKKANQLKAKPLVEKSSSASQPKLDLEKQYKQLSLLNGVEIGDDLDDEEDDEDEEEAKKLMGATNAGKSKVANVKEPNEVSKASEPAPPKLDLEKQFKRLTLLNGAEVSDDHDDDDEDDEEEDEEDEEEEEEGGTKQVDTSLEIIKEEEDDYSDLEEGWFLPPERTKPVAVVVAHRDSLSLARVKAPDVVVVYDSNADLWKRMDGKVFPKSSNKDMASSMSVKDVANFLTADIPPMERESSPVYLKVMRDKVQGSTLKDATHESLTKLGITSALTRVKILAKIRYLK
eukprot:gb/GEZN01000564.1/.p1 GENE.gb/GEZN01000564.1/~~gb/GEZN01000564.1/.p1  ORF type:complete len:1209 (-),score=311.46 gb/GEZN01000564.1/:368-3994(-)